MERQAHNSLNEAAIEVQRQTHEGEESLQEEGLQRILRKAKAGKLTRKDARQAMERQKLRNSAKSGDTTPNRQRKRDYEVDSMTPGIDDFPTDIQGNKYRILAPKNQNNANASVIRQAWIDSQKTPIAKLRASGRIDTPMNARPKLGRSTFAGLSDRARSGEAGKMAPKYDHVEYDEVNPMVLEYFNNYFGDNLTEDTSDEDIMEAVYDLIDLTEAVMDAVGLEEAMDGYYFKGEKEGDFKDETKKRHPDSTVDKGPDGEGVPTIKHDTAYLPNSRNKKIPDVVVPPKYRPKVDAPADSFLSSILPPKSNKPIRTLKPSADQLRTALAKQARNKK